MSKKTLIISVLSGLFFASNICLALEVNLPGLSSTPNLIDYRNFIFNFLIGLGGALAVLSIAIGGIGYVVSAGNPESISNAKDRIRGAILGLILLMGSYVLIQTINPKITPAAIEGLTGGYGVYLSDGSKDEVAPSSMPDISAIPSQINLLKYKCVTYDKNTGKEIPTNSGPTLLVWKFAQKNMTSWTKSFVNEVKCGSSTGIRDALSIVTGFEGPGIYLYDQTSCGQKAVRSFNVQQSYSDLSKVFGGYFNKNLKSVRLINDLSVPDNQQWYGLILHDNINFGGKCTLPLGSSANLLINVCLQTTNNASGAAFSAASLEFFRYSKDSFSNLKNVGDGIELYSEPFGWEKWGRGDIGRVKIDTNKLGAVISSAHSADYSAKVDTLTFDYGPGTSDEYKQRCKNFKNCPGSIRNLGRYIIVLYAKDSSCQSYYSDATNLNDSWIVGRPDFDSVHVIPID